MFRKILKETLLELSENTPFLLEEMGVTTSTTFDIHELMKLKTYKDKINYCNTHLKKIGVGTSRIVYQIDNQWVLKLAKNRKGLAQNDDEITLSNEKASHLIAEISDYDSSEYPYWVKMQYAKPATKKEFERLMGISTKRLLDLLFNMSISRLDKSDYELIEELGDEHIIHELHALIISYNVEYGDLARHSSYGITNDGGEELVIIDYGLTTETYTTYYSR